MHPMTGLRSDALPCGSARETEPTWWAEKEPRNGTRQSVWCMWCWATV